MRNNKGIIWGFLLTMLLAVVGPQTAFSFDAETYFKGKTIRFVTGSRPGGGTDILLRYLAGNWGKFFPGNPRFVVTNFPPPRSRTELCMALQRERVDGIHAFDLHLKGAAPLAGGVQN